MADGETDFPTLKSLTEIANAYPTLIVDTREQRPLQFEHLPSIPGTLTTGDYSIEGCEDLVSIEKKSIQDFVGCCMGDNRERFKRELVRLRGYRFKRLLIIGQEDDIRAGNYISNIKPQSVLATLNAFEMRYEVPVVFMATPQLAAVAVERWAITFAREQVKPVAGLLRSILRRQKLVTASTRTPVSMPESH